MDRRHVVRGLIARGVGAFQLVEKETTGESFIELKSTRSRTGDSAERLRALALIAGTYNLD